MKKKLGIVIGALALFALVEAVAAPYPSGSSGGTTTSGGAVSGSAN